MGDRLKFERFIWFHGRVKSGKYPNSRHLGEKFELSARTAQRDIEFMRDRLNAPLEYNRDRRGYFYTDQSYEMPESYLSEENVLALALAVRLASSIPDKKIKEQLCSFLDRVSNYMGAEGACTDGVQEKISVKNIEYSRVDGRLFQPVVDALFRNRSARIIYRSPHSKNNTKRLIVPLHLMHYMGSWYIVAYCTQKKDLRDFALSRISEFEVSDTKVELPEDLPSIKEYTRRNFGIMQGGKEKTVRLRFSPLVAEWVQEQIWHPQQSVSVEKDDSLILTVPVADFREIKRRILSYGAEVKVLEPEELAKEIKEEIAKMAELY